MSTTYDQTFRDGARETEAHEEAAVQHAAGRARGASGEMVFAWIAGLLAFAAYAAGAAMIGIGTMESLMRG